MNDENICPICSAPSSTMTGSGRQWVCMNYQDERHADNNTRYWPATKSETLLPCPFCGKAPGTMGKNTPQFARCYPCGVTWMDIATWNTRAGLRKETSASAGV